VGWLHRPTVSAEVLTEVKEDTGVEVEPHVPEGSYWESLLWYNRELMKDDYVMAALLFVVGAVSPWQTFEHLGGIIDRLEEFQQQEPDQPDDDEPQPEISLGQKLLAKAAKEQVIQFNPHAALQKQIFADGFVPNSPEFEVEHQGSIYVAQRAEHLHTGEVRVYHVKKGDWAHVLSIRRGEDGKPWPV
jgi:hypothetical protein